MRLKINYFFLMLIIALPLKGFGQTNKRIPTEWIKTIAAHRNDLLTKNAFATVELKHLFEKSAYLPISDEFWLYLTATVLMQRSLYDASYSEIQSVIAKRYQDIQFAAFFNKPEIEIIEKNGDLLNLLFTGILQPKYPFKINPKTKAFEEINEYNIQANEKIGEIGAGIGDFSLLLKRLNPNAKYFVNDLNKDFIKYLKYRMNHSLDKIDTTNLEIFLGAETSTNLEGFDLDKIIARHAYHHFSKKKAMLHSIKKSLNDNGKLYLLETIPKLNRNKVICSKALSRRRIIRKLKSNGFSLVNEIQIGGDILFTFEKQ